MKHILPRKRAPVCRLFAIPASAAGLPSSGATVQTAAMVSASDERKANGDYWPPIAESLLHRTYRHVDQCAPISTRPTKDAWGVARMTVLLRMRPKNAPVIQAVAFTSPSSFALFAAFCTVFFCRRGNRIFCLFTSFGTFGFAGAVTPTAAAIFPAAAPMVLAAPTRTPSGGACVSFFFVMR